LFLCSRTSRDASMHTGQHGWLPNESGCVLAWGDYVKAALGLGDDYSVTWTDVNGAWDKFVHIP
jgi:hypothetical protein